MPTNFTPVAGGSGAASELIEQIEAQGFKSQGRPLTKYGPWQKLKSVIGQVEMAVNRCWRIVAEVRQGINQLALKQSRVKEAVEVDAKKR